MPTAVPCFTARRWRMALVACRRAMISPGWNLASARALLRRIEDFDAPTPIALRVA